MSRNVHHRRTARPAPRRLRVERLEDRSLLAVAAFTMQLREDLGGVPGDVLAADEVAVGDCFYVEILAQEFHPLFQGLHGVALNIAWNPAVLEEIDAGFDLSQIVTDHLPLFRGGTLDNAAGAIDNLSGSAFHASGIGRSIGNGTAERFALLHFRAESEAAAAAIRLSEGKSSIVTQPAATFASSQLSFEEQTIEIIAEATSAQLAAPPPDIVPPNDLPPNDPPQPEPLPPQVEEIAAPPEEIAGPAPQVPLATDPQTFLLALVEPPEDVPAEEIAPAPAPAIEVAIHTLASPAPAATSVCPEEPSYAAAVDAVLMGPLTPEQFTAQPAHSVFRLHDLIALLATDSAERRKATVLNLICE
jgi:hypothetical protein